MRYKPADHGPRVGRKWSDPVRAVILRAESALLPRGRGGPLGGPAPAARAAGKTRAPKWDPRDQSRSVQWFLRESAFLPAVGEALGGSSTRSSRCGTSPCSIPHPNMSAPYSPPYDSRPPQAQSGQCGSPQAGPGYRWQATDSESVDSPGQLPQHASRLPKLFNLDCIVGMGEYLARGTMGTSPMAQGIGG